MTTTLQNTGVGWTLREIFNVYPAVAFAFMTQHIKLLSPIAFSSATEKLSKESKGPLKEKRRRR